MASEVSVLGMDVVDERTRAHYDAVARRTSGSRASEVLRDRSSGAAYPLKVYHNSVKRALISRVGRVSRLLDIGCGRGGDIRKWIDAGVRSVVGVDASSQAVREARSRFAQTVAQTGSSIACDFRTSMPRVAPGSYDVVTCMFALQYFFESRESARRLLQTIATALRPGGWFVGVVPDGDAVLRTLDGAVAYENRHLVLRLSPSGNNNAYTCAIRDTVTDAMDDDDGSHEYLVTDATLCEIASSVGLVPARIGAPHLLADRTASKRVFWAFEPSYPGDPELEIASRLFAAFAFVRTS